MSVDTRFALGTFRLGGALPDDEDASARRGDGDSFAGLVLGDRVVDLGRRLGPATTVRRLVDDWPESFARLQALANEIDPDAADHDLALLRPLPPVLPCG